MFLYFQSPEPPIQVWNRGEKFQGSSPPTSLSFIYVLKTVIRFVWNMSGWIKVILVYSYNMFYQVLDCLSFEFSRLDVSIYKRHFEQIYTLL